MSRRRKLTPQGRYIWEQAERIGQSYFSALQHGQDLAEVRSRWQKLWQETEAGEKLGTIPIEAAGYLLWWGYNLAMEDGRYDAATELMSAYFQHPEIDRDDALTRLQHRCNLATSILFSGDESAAVEILRPLLECERKSLARHARDLIRRGLTHYLPEPAGDKQALPALTDLVEEIMNRFRRRVPRKKRLPENATYADLLRLLDSTYPPSGRAALQAERASRNETRAG